MKSTIAEDINALAQQTSVQNALADAATHTESLIDDSIAFQQISAPTFDEHRRAEHLRQQFEQADLADVSIDEMGVVYARLPGSDPTTPAVMVSAHLDTVFPNDTDLTVRRNGKRLYGPGLGDNSLGLAAMLALPRILSANKLQPTSDVWLVGTVREEGLGNSDGMHNAVRRLKDQLGLVVVVEGMALGHIFHRGLGVRRLRVSLRGPGGHSWLNYGRPSAIHHLLKLGAKLSDVSVPSGSRSSLNIGLIEGGTSINTIAPFASLSIDLRSIEAATLDKLEKRVRRAIDQFSLPRVISRQIEVIGNRPAASLPREHPLVRASGQILKMVGMEQVTYEAASTDANVPLANSLPSVCIGITSGGNAHSPEEYIDPAGIGSGLQQLVLLTLASAHNSRQWSVWDNVG